MAMEKNMRRRSILGLALVFAATFGLTPVRPRDAQAASATNVLAGGGIAIHGYDPVAFFVEGGPRKGRAELALDHGGARWLFASEANRERFRAEPEKYLPAYGGYCAYGVAQGYLVKIDPEAWAIVNGRLYLNYDRSVARTWRKDVPGYVAKADANWPSLVAKP
jgi:YHS domain-containing protein